MDMSDFICADGVCPAVVGNVYVYKDDNHLTKTYMQRMIADVRAAAARRHRLEVTPAALPSNGVAHIRRPGIWGSPPRFYVFTIGDFCTGQARNDGLVICCNPYP